MSKKIIINIPFNSFDFDDFFKKKDIIPPRLTKEWIDYRIDIFMNYTYKSLISQTNQDFTALISYDPLSYDLVMQALSKYNKLPENIIFLPKNNDLLYKLIQGYDYLYLVRLDSDDMYLPSFIDQLHKLNIDSSIECILNQDGYVYHIHKDKLGLWKYPSPPFYALVYKVSDFLNGFRYVMPRGHSSAINLKCKILHEKNYMVIVHNKNTSTEFHTKFNVGMIKSNTEKNKILKEFKIKN